MKKLWYLLIFVTTCIPSLHAMEMEEVDSAERAPHPLEIPFSTPRKRKKSTLKLTPRANTLCQTAGVPLPSPYHLTPNMFYYPSITAGKIIREGIASGRLRSLSPAEFKDFETAATLQLLSIKRSHPEAQITLDMLTVLKGAKNRSFYGEQPTTALNPFRPLAARKTLHF